MVYLIQISAKYNNKTTTELRLTLKFKTTLDSATSSTLVGVFIQSGRLGYLVTFNVPTYPSGQFHFNPNIKILYLIKNTFVVM